MTPKLDRLTVKGFKSICELENFELEQLNVLIGSNGSGKSNFVEIFRVLRAMVDQRLGVYVSENGGADGFLFNGPKITPSIQAHFCFGKNEYKFELASSVNGKFIFQEEAEKYELGSWRMISSGGDSESRLHQKKLQPGWKADLNVSHYVFEALSNWTVYHFHDTSNASGMRRSEIIEDNAYLRPTASNIAPFLLQLKNRYEKAYKDILESIRLVAPFFDAFRLFPFKEGTREKVKLDWKQKGSDFPMQPYHLSDGTMRFICLATALLQPNPPSTILIDEPELGLHPYAIEILAALIKATSHKTQVIISTQSPPLVDCFEPEDIIVVNRKDGKSIFERLNKSDLSKWLEDCSLGELWRKDVLKGGPNIGCGRANRANVCPRNASPLYGSAGHLFVSQHNW